MTRRRRRRPRATSPPPTARRSSTSGCRLGLTDAVVSPGLSIHADGARARSRTTASALHVHHDERSAAFMALGLGLASGRPTIVLSTSGTAAAEFHAAVVEAHQADVPLLVVTADRPPELHGVGAPQTIDQRELYGSCGAVVRRTGRARRGVEPPWWRDLARDAWLRCGGTDARPRAPEPGVPRAAGRTARGSCPRPARSCRRYPRARRGGSPTRPSDELAAVIDGRRGLIVAGVRAARDRAEADAVAEMAAALGWPVLADASSGVRDARPGVITTFDPLLRDEVFAESAAPRGRDPPGRSAQLQGARPFLAGLGRLPGGRRPVRAARRSRRGHHPPPHRGRRDVLRPDPVGRRRQPAPAEWLATWVDADSTARRAIGRVLTRHGDADRTGGRGRPRRDAARRRQDGRLVVDAGTRPRVVRRGPIRVAGALQPRGERHRRGRVDRGRRRP